ncbi:MAG: hypothetical protein ABEJ08_02665 [Halobacteriaceae archaeon]
MTDEDDEVRVPIVCPDCETTAEVPLADVGEAVSRHNERLHGGEEVAEVDPELSERLADLVAEELGLLDDDA